MGLTTSLSRVLGLVRTVLLAHVFGTSIIGDLFFLAFKIPNLLRRMFAEGTMSSCFIPLYQQIKKNPPFPGAPIFFFRKTLTILFLIVSAVVFLGIMTSSFTMHYFFFLTEGTSMQSLETGSILLKIMFPYLLFVSLAAILQGLLNSHDSFALPAFTSVLLNGVIIIGAFFILINNFAGEQAAIIVAFSVTLGGAFQLAFLIPSVYKLGASFKPTLLGMNQETKRFFLLMGPVIFSSSVYQINQIIIDPIVMHLGAGSVSALQYSVRLQELPIGIVIVSLTTVTLPTLSNLINSENTHHFQEKINQLFRFIILTLTIIVPIGITAREDIVYLLFKSGQFDLEAVSITARCLMFHLLGLLPIGFYRILNNIFFALQDTKTPLLVSLYSLPINVIFAYSLSTTYNMGAPGIALATTLSTFFSVMFLYQYLRKKITIRITKETYLFCGKILIFILFYLILADILFKHSLSNLLSLELDFWGGDKLHRAIDLIGFTLVYMIAFLIFAYFFKIQEVFFFFNKKKS